MVTQKQKQWILSSLDLSHLQMAMATEISLHRSSGRPVPHHLKNLEELATKLAAIAEATARQYYENDPDDQGVPCEKLLVTLIEDDENEAWSDPYTMVPDGKKWAVVDKQTLRRVGEKSYTQKTHAYRAKRRLNEKARLAFEDKRGWTSTPALDVQAEAEALEDHS